MRRSSRRLRNRVHGVAALAVEGTFGPDPEAAGRVVDLTLDGVALCAGFAG